MKLPIKAFKLLMFSAAMLATTQLLAREDADVQKTKSYEKSYTVSAGDNISINNRFGETRLETWNSSEVKVEVKMRVVATSDDRAQSLMDDISIEDGKSGSGVYFKTNMRSHTNNGKGHTEMHIDYLVHLPATNPLELETQFGDTYLPDYSGPVSIVNKFGSIKAGRLANVKDITVEFGKGNIESINNGRLVAKYSGMTIGKLSGDIDAKFEFCDGSDIALDNSIKSFTLVNNYSSVNITTAKDINASFDIQTHFGEFKNRTDFAIKDNSDDEERGPKFDYHYSGKAGNGDVAIKIKSSFGNTKIM